MEIIACSNNCVRLVNVFANGNCGVADCDRCDAFDVFDFENGFDVLEREARFGILARVSQFVDDTVGNVFAVARADEDEVGVVLVAAGADEAVDAAGEGHNKDDTSDADGDAEGGQESAATVFAEAIHGEVEVRV